MLGRADEKRKDAMFCAGIVASTLINLKLEKGARPISPKDFLPDERPRNATEDELIDGFLAVFSEVMPVNKTVN